LRSGAHGRPLAKPANIPVVVLTAAVLLIVTATSRHQITFISRAVKAFPVWLFLPTLCK
jgi:hypothetical protein